MRWFQMFDWQDEDITLKASLQIALFRLLSLAVITVNCVKRSVQKVLVVLKDELR